jgi:hypothetical protein
MPLLWTAPAFVAIACLLALDLAELLAWALRLDRADHAWSSLAWTARSWRAAAVWFGAGTLVALALGAAACAFVGTEGWIYGVLLLACWALLVPFLAGNVGNLWPARPSLLWRPGWPGWPAIAVGLAMLVASELADRGLSHAATMLPESLRPSVALANHVLLTFAKMLAAAYVAFVWLNRGRARLAPAQRRWIFRGEVLRAQLVYYLRATSLVLVLPPLLMVAVLVVFLVPQVEDAMRAGGGPSAPVFHSAVWVARFVAEWWWVVLAFPVFWFVVAWPSRMFVQLGFVSPDLPASPSRST